MLASDTTTVMMSGYVGGCGYVRAGVSTRARNGTWGGREECGLDFPAACCLALCLLVAGNTTFKSEISGSGVALIGVVHMAVAFAPTVLCTFLVRSVPSVRSQALSSLI